MYQKMTKRSFNLRKVAAIVACLAGITVFSGCDKEPDPIDTGMEQEANIVAFTFAGIDGMATIDKTAHTVTAKAKETVDLTAIKAEFTLSKNATATVNGTAQVSKTTVNNFTNLVTYSVTSADGKTTNDWTVTITKTGSNNEFGEMPEYFSLTRTFHGTGVEGSPTITDIRTADGYYERRTGDGLMSEEWIILHPEEDLSTYYQLCTGQPLYTETKSLESGKDRGSKWVVEAKGERPNVPPYVRMGDETILGRNCAKFVLEVNVPSVTSKEEYWIDKETGAELKYTLDFQNEAGTVKGSRIVTEYKVGGVTLPPHP